MIYIEPIGGLCNRMRSVLSAYRYAVDNSMDMTVLWWCHDECNCRFEDIFDLSAMKEKSEIGINVINMPFVGNGYLFCRIRHFIKKRVVNKYVSKCDIKLENAVNDDIVSRKDEIKTAKDIFVSSYSEWYGKDNDFGFFIFRSELENKIDPRIKGQDQVVGIHIRRTDNAVSIEHSSTEMFIQKIDNIISEDQSVKFYIATDDADLKEDLIKRYDNKIICNNDAELKRSSRKGLTDAAVDILSLSLCSYIIGSYYSSFSEVAALIGDKKLIVLKDNML